MIDHWVDDWDREQVGSPIALEAGHRYDIKVEFFEHFGGSNLHLRWSSPSQPKEIVPASAFFLPAGYQYDGPTSATVSRDGTMVALGFDRDLRPLPAGAADHLTIAVNYTRWPAAGMALDPADPSTIVVRLSRPIPEGGQRGPGRLRRRRWHRGGRWQPDPAVQSLRRQQLDL